MKNIIPVILLVAVFVGGCAADVAQQLRVARTAADTALDTQHAAVTAHLITPAQVAAVLPYERVIYAALDAGQQASLAGDASTAKTFLDAALAGLAKYAAIVPKSTVVIIPATQPNK